MTENQISHEVLGCALTVHRYLGPGLLESVYEEVLVYELEKRGLSCDRQVTLPVKYESLELSLGFRVDVIIENSVILELKSVESLLPVHKKQLLTYLRLTNMRLGLLINFNVPLIKEGFSRVVNRL
ncbi:MAG: GxxExxY protein [Ignavibacteria bacterium RIFCSPLOWO2_02_FULL_55_14]|nr:MAG: GxxExxY protein [Ignavibacteria bacterium GWC2_56_12]OGU64819.1 MAG: GxxExxY protein [Ignavibacteria bacterium RIFCSPHIGHO2_02_FULL_56_12]OGU69518.1 MAG: GxxExxY protein [Ignavibacteria bacterium RIFCSPLOWO2_02_FULL_55_14]